MLIKIGSFIKHVATKAILPGIIAGAFALSADANEDLFRAIETNSPTALQAAVKAGASVDAPDHEGDYPLHTAVRSDAAAKLVAILIKAKVNVNQPDQNGNSALMIAAANKKAPVVDMLIKAGAKVDFQGQLGYTALTGAARHGDIATIRNLLKAKANIEIPTSDGMKAICIVAAKGHLEALKAMLKAKANPNVLCGDIGYTPLMFAAAENNPDIARALIAGKADVEFKSISGRTALFVAVAYTNAHPSDPSKVTDLLIQAGAKIEAALESK